MAFAFRKSVRHAAGRSTEGCKCIRKACTHEIGTIRASGFLDALRKTPRAFDFPQRPGIGPDRHQSERPAWTERKPAHAARIRPARNDQFALGRRERLHVIGRFTPTRSSTGAGADRIERRCIGDDSDDDATPSDVRRGSPSKRQRNSVSHLLAK
jgi:hypothetical protein